MGVIYIGDRAAGKTHLALELTNPHAERVKIEGQDYEDLKAKLFVKGEIEPTDIDNPHVSQTYPLTVQVELKVPVPPIVVDWIDTPGEIYRRSWQQSNPEQWQIILSKIQQSKGLMLILPPYRGMPNLKPYDDNLHKLPTQQQWINRFQRWVDFLQNSCPRVRHIVICLNKADLFTDIVQEAQRLSYSSRMGWNHRNMYVIENYFRPVYPQLQTLAQNNSGSVCCFITTIYNRELLELPWLYLAGHLSS